MESDVNSSELRMTKKRLKCRCKKYFKDRKRLKKLVAESIINECSDSRYYADVEIAGVRYHGLLDSGANITVVGTGCEKLLMDPNVDFSNFSSTIKVANGGGARIIGLVRVWVKFNGISRKMKIHLATQLKQNLYLGVDFWDLFGIKPVISNGLIKNDQRFRMSPEFDPNC